jgi:hypothetical protein
VVNGLIATPGDADGIDIFDFGLIFDFRHDDCEKRCDETPRCVAYTQFATFYHDSNFYAACVGRTSKYGTEDDDPSTLSGIKPGTLSSKLLAKSVEIVIHNV